MNFLYNYTSKGQTISSSWCRRNTRAADMDAFGNIKIVFRDHARVWLGRVVGEQLLFQSGIPRFAKTAPGVAWRSRERFSSTNTDCG